MRKLRRVPNSIQVRPSAVAIVKTRRPMNPEIYVMIIIKKIRTVFEIRVYGIL